SLDVKYGIFQHHHHGSGAKIKRSIVKQYDSLGLLGSHAGQTFSGPDVNIPEQPIDSLILDTGGFYFESSEDGHWEMIDTKEAFSNLLSALDSRGAREARLLASLEKRESSLIQAMSNTPNDGGNRQQAHSDQSEVNTSREDSSSPVSDVDNRLSLSEMQSELPSSTSTATVDGGKKGEQLLEKPECDQCQDLYWRDEKHCRICHTTFELDFDLEERYAVHSAVCQANNDVNKCRSKRVLSSQLQALKAAIYAIESAIPEDDALMRFWKRSAHNLWVNRLRRASNLREFLQVLADLVTAIDEDWFYRNNILDSYCALEEIISNFSTMPQTYSAVALWYPCPQVVESLWPGRQKRGKMRKLSASLVWSKVKVEGYPHEMACFRLYSDKVAILVQHEAMHSLLASCSFRFFHKEGIEPMLFEMEELLPHIFAIFRRLCFVTVFQNLNFGGLKSASSSAATASSNLVPAITFIMAYAMG
ncbi:Homeobox-DDT domain protein RLT3, partial [Sesamum angolense]